MTSRSTNPARPDTSTTRIYSAQDVLVTNEGAAVFLTMENHFQGRTRVVLQPNQADALATFVEASAQTARTGEEPPLE